MASTLKSATKFLRIPGRTLEVNSEMKASEKSVRDFSEKVYDPHQGKAKLIPRSEIIGLKNKAFTFIRMQHIIKSVVDNAKNSEGYKALEEEEQAKYLKEELNKVVLAFFDEIIEKGWIPKSALTPTEIRWIEANITNEISENVSVSDLSSWGEEEKKPEEGEEEEEMPKEVMQPAVEGKVVPTPIPAPKEKAPSAPIANPKAPVADPRRLEDYEVRDLIMMMDGLQHDSMNADELRASLFRGRREFTVQSMVILCSAYIYIGNNSTKLTNKVKDVALGNNVLGVLNAFGVVARKTTSKTLTLPRIGIIFSPVIWALRHIYAGMKKLGSSGIVTSTPLTLQDVSLSGASQFISGGDSIKDFLVKFNRVLFKVKEKDAKRDGRTPENEMDEIAEKFYNLSIAGARNDPIVSNWLFNEEENKTEKGIHAFYAKCVAAYGEEEYF